MFSRSPTSRVLLLKPEAFADLYQETYMAVFRFIYGLHGGPTEQVEDLAAETYIRAWRARKRFRGEPAGALAWLLQIARNLVIDDARRQKRRGLALDIEAQVIPSPGASIEEQAAQQEQIQILWGLLRELPVEQREMLVLRYLLGWRVKDIAAQMGMPENTVSVYLKRTLVRLRQYWPEDN